MTTCHHVHLGLQVTPTYKDVATQYNLEVSPKNCDIEVQCDLLNQPPSLNNDDSVEYCDDMELDVSHVTDDEDDMDTSYEYAGDQTDESDSDDDDNDIRRLVLSLHSHFINYISEYSVSYISFAI